jgi:sugar/nucleoside kinase (ribokinase family)
MTGVLACLGECIWDLLVLADVGEDPLPLGLPAGISFAGERQGLLAFAERAGGEVERVAGGTVSNAMHAAAHASLERGTARRRYVWTGHLPASGPAGEALPTDALHPLGVEVACHGPAAQTGLTACVIDRASLRVRALLVWEPPVAWDRPLDVGGRYDLLLSLLQFADPANGPAVAAAERLHLLVGGCGSLSGGDRDRLVDAAALGRLRYLFGRVAELRHLGLLDPGCRRLPGVDGVELIGTDGPRHVRVWPPGAAEPLLLAVPGVTMTGDDLGAGDGYAGAYLSARLDGLDVAGAHDAAAAYAARVLQVTGSRLRVPGSARTLDGRP